MMNPPYQLSVSEYTLKIFWSSLKLKIPRKHKKVSFWQKSDFKLSVPIFYVAEPSGSPKPILQTQILLFSKSQKIKRL